MTDSIEDNAAIYKKYYTYVPSTLPADLIESINFTLNSQPESMYMMVRLDMFTIHIITLSRVITPDFLKRIFSLMGNILLFILDRHEKYKRVLFSEIDLIKLSSMVFGGENILVIESKSQDGCRV